MHPRRILLPFDGGQVALQALSQGSPAVELTIRQGVTPQTVYLNPDEARDLARALLELAGHADSLITEEAVRPKPATRAWRLRPAGDGPWS